MSCKVEDLKRMIDDGPIGTFGHQNLVQIPNSPTDSW